MRRASAIRAGAWAVVAVGVAAPLARKHVRAPAVIVQAIAFAAPLGMCVAARRSRTRDVATCCLQMWAYVAAYKHPHDDPQAQRRSTRFRYPIVADRVLGLGELPSVRMQRALARVGPNGPQWTATDRALVWTHWSWFFVPHAAVAFILARHPRRFPRAAALTYAVFDIGASIYWVLPTAPPWYAAAEYAGIGGERAERGGAGLGEAAVQIPEVRRMMVEYGEFFWGDGWPSLYSVFGGNPLAAMPSLHFATSLMAALLLAEVGLAPGAIGFGYLAALGFALVYLGEHYAVDLLGGVGLTVIVRRLAPAAAPLAVRFARAVSTLEHMAHAA